MREKIELIKKVVLWTLGNAFVYNVLFPLLYLCWISSETPENEIV